MALTENKGKEKVHILVVEDSPTQAVKLEYLLTEHGYAVSVTGNGREALEFLKGVKPDLIISDIIMPFMDGYELCRAVRADSTLSGIPVILLTSLSDPEEVINGLQCGADNFITKPYNEQFILSHIAQIIANRQFRQTGIAEQGIDIYHAGKTYHITSNRFQIIDLLLSTFENAIQKNRELDEVNKELLAVHDQLKKTNAELLQLNLELDKRVADRTAEIERKSEEIKTISRQLWQAEKLATIGELAASIAHELNNPLATVSLRLESLTDQMPEDDPRLRELNIIGQEAERMAKLVATLLQTSRRNQPQISTVNACEEIDNTLELIHFHLHKYNVKVIREFAPDVPNIHADRQQLRQLFLNLFTNAGDAMQSGGTLTVRAYVQEAEGRELRAESKGKGDEKFGGVSLKESETTSNLQPATQNRFVVIEVADTGVGIPPELLSKVIEPFFTTKPEGKGTGLGLSICRRIVQDHKGTIEIISNHEIPSGTIVRIALPVAGPSASSRNLYED
ncbi:MAG: Sporulation kinase E [Syntrophorhabdus sp. PtaU1.Bin058]|nr:MAG: Sporulation kinase E [Syntrophorhabdus sp. PtaU1.Bin058]